MIAAISNPTCAGLHVDCQVLIKGVLVVVTAFTLFVGSILLLLSAVFGRKMGYLVLAVSFFGWMAIFSSLWTFGFFSQGTTTPVDLGPRGSEPAWVPLAAGENIASFAYDQFKNYPDGSEWKVPGTNETIQSSVQSVSTSVAAFLAKEANTKLGKGPFDPGALQTTDFTVSNIRFASAGKVSLAAAEANYNGGGPILTVYLYHDSGSVIRYSWMFLIGSILGLLIHLPLLDRAEKKRKEILTGGSAPPWYGPA